MHILDATQTPTYARMIMGEMCSTLSTFPHNKMSSDYAHPSTRYTQVIIIIHKPIHSLTANILNNRLSATRPHYHERCVRCWCENVDATVHVMRCERARKPTPGARVLVVFVFDSLAVAQHNTIRICAKQISCARVVERIRARTTFHPVQAPAHIKPHHAAEQQQQQSFGCVCVHACFLTRCERA